MTDSLTLKLPPVRLVPIGEVKPYEANPRKITKEDVEAVAFSIAKYGYVQPILVDQNFVIIVGHTRHAAALELGVQMVQVAVSDMPEEKAREYRLVDNRTKEFTTWDGESLVIELREFEDDLLSRFFPDVDLEIGLIEKAGEPHDMEAAEKKVTRVAPGDETNTHMTGVLCPNCMERFEVRTRTLPGLTFEDMERLTEGAPDGEVE